MITDCLERQKLGWPGPPDNPPNPIKVFDWQRSKTLTEFGIACRKSETCRAPEIRDLTSPKARFIPSAHIINHPFRARPSNRQSAIGNRNPRLTTTALLGKITA